MDTREGSSRDFKEFGSRSILPKSQALMTRGQMNTTQSVYLQTTCHRFFKRLGRANNFGHVSGTTLAKLAMEQENQSYGNANFASNPAVLDFYENTEGTFGSR